MHPVSSRVCVVSPPFQGEGGVLTRCGPRATLKIGKSRHLVTTLRRIYSPTRHKGRLLLKFEDGESVIVRDRSTLLPAIPEERDTGSETEEANDELHAIWEDVYGVLLSRGYDKAADIIRWTVSCSCVVLCVALAPHPFLFEGAKICHGTVW